MLQVMCYQVNAYSADCVDDMLRVVYVWEQIM